MDGNGNVLKLNDLFGKNVPSGRGHLISNHGKSEILMRTITLKIMKYILTVNDIYT